MKDTNATVIVDLEGSEEEIMNRLHKDARWGIKRAIREGLKVETPKTEEDWKEFYDIYKETMIEGGANPAELEELKKNSIVMFICKKEEKIIAGAGLEIKEALPTLYINASIKEYLKYQPNNLLYWNCILWSKKEGYNKLDLGGWQINASGHLEGINKFKEKWGKIIYTEKEYPLLKALGRKLIRDNKLLWEINKKLKGRK